MFKILSKLFPLCFYVCLVLATEVSDNLDLQTCIDNFKVEKDRIIRTQDSRNMGAKYLNEFDLGSREECLRLCCETATCDVFVYEEKSPGSCYLFHCGPPEDFKCKFTRHANYSSAVLGINRHLNELENQIKLTKHEQDLTKLRKSSDDTREVKVPTSTVTTVLTVKPEEVAAVVPSISSPPVAVRKCSQYQFECRTSGECIAIYNACDGIPQCADASDEALELNCPEVATTQSSPPQLPLQVPAGSVYHNPSQSLRKSLPPMQESYHPETAQHVQVVAPHSEDFLRPVNPHNGATGQNMVPQFGNEPVVDSQYYTQQQVQGWIHQPGSVQNQYPDKNSHIFNHKDAGLQMADNPDSSLGMQYTDINQHPEYQKPYYNADTYRHAAEPWQQQYHPNRDSTGENQDNWPVQPQVYPDSMQYHPIDAQNWQQVANIPTQQQQQKKYPQLDESDHREIKNLEEKHEKMETKHEKPHPKEVKHKNHHENEHTHTHIQKALADELKSVKIDALHDGEAERPGGAILSLTLGVCITCVMAILIGCRLKVVRRRMRRGGKSPYAHDADYLVNGMYL